MPGEAASISIAAAQHLSIGRAIDSMMQDSPWNAPILLNIRKGLHFPATRLFDVDSKFGPDRIDFGLGFAIHFQQCGPWAVEAFRFPFAGSVYPHL